jgi:lipopolysaccharide/colanic/teichoic acid biosynthesis glycosyltransferase
MKTDMFEVKTVVIGSAVKVVSVERIWESIQYDFLKRMIDVVGSIIAFMVLSPFFLITTLFLKIFSPGPVFYRQARVGQYGKHFEIYKFRTMKVDAEKYSGPVWATKNDNRLIPGGNFLRKSKIDEIPQFINVLKGEMSIIGPRPERPFFVERLKKQIPDYEKRLNIKPGITGLAQVLHQADETIKDVKLKIKYDLLYIRKMCLLTDVHILLQTVRFVFMGVRPRARV